MNLLNDLDLSRFCSLSEYVGKASAAGACRRELWKLSQYRSLKQLLEVEAGETVAFWILWYVNHVKQARWPEAEPILISCGRPAINYLVWYVTKWRPDPWPELEELCLKYPDSAYLYARDVLHGRWPEAEEVLQIDPYWWDLYQKHTSLPVSIRGIPVSISQEHVV